MHPAAANNEPTRRSVAEAKHTPERRKEPAGPRFVPERSRNIRKDYTKTAAGCIRRNKGNNRGMSESRFVSNRKTIQTRARVVAIW